MKHVITQSFLKSLGSWRWLQWEWDAGCILPAAFVASYVLISPSFVFSGPSHLHRDWGNWKPNWGRVSLCGSWDSHLQARCVSLRCPSSAFPPHIPNLPLRCTLSANTALYDLKRGVQGKDDKITSRNTGFRRRELFFLSWALSDLWGPTEEFPWAPIRQRESV